MKFVCNLHKAFSEIFSAIFWNIVLYFFYKQQHMSQFSSFFIMVVYKRDNNNKIPFSKKACESEKLDFDKSESSMAK